MAVKPIPEGYHSVTPYLVVDGAGELLEFVKQVFDAQERMRMPGKKGEVAHAEVTIGDSVIMMGDASGAESGPMQAMIHLYVDDADKTFQRAIEAGATQFRELQDEFYGDRSGGVKDRWGNLWWIATHIEDVSDEEMAKRAEAAAGQT